MRAAGLPVHPTLARVLAEWKLAGWERTYGRQPTDDDLVVPTRNGTERTGQEAPKGLRLNLDALSLRARRGHDLRTRAVTPPLQAPRGRAVVGVFL